MRLCLWRFTGGSTLAWLFYMWDPLRSGASNKGQDQGNTHPTNGHLLRGEYPEYTDRNGRRGGGRSMMRHTLHNKLYGLNVLMIK